MNAVRLIYFNGCPNAEKAKALLRRTGIQFQEIRQDDLPETDQFRAYTSPTILNGDEIVVGEHTRVFGGCSVNIPSAQELKRRFERKGDVPKNRGSISSVVGSIFSAAMVGFCPVCIPAVGAFFSAIGLGFLVQEAVLKPLLVIFLAITLFGYFWSYVKEHGRLSPLLLGIIMAIGLYVSRYVFLGGSTNTPLMYGSIAGIISVSLWNIRLKKAAECCSCSSKLSARRDGQDTLPTERLHCDSEKSEEGL